MVPVSVARGVKSGGKNNSRLASWSWLAFCFTFYCMAGPATIFLNQHVLTQVHFPYPAVLSLLGVTMSSVAASSLIVLGVVPSNHLHDVTPRFYMLRVTPIGLALAGTLASGNNVYLHLSIAFIQILKSLSPVILLGLLWLTRIEQPRALLALAVFVIVTGMVAATEGELRVTWMGVTLMLFSELCDSVKAISLQILLSDRKFDSFECLAIFGPAAITGLCVVSFFTEDYDSAIAIILDHPLLFFFASVSGFGVNLATNLFIKATSALTLRITSIARNVVIVLVAAIFRRDSHVTRLEFAGYCVSLMGVSLYNFARINSDETIAGLTAKLRGACLPSGR